MGENMSVPEETQLVEGGFKYKMARESFVGPEGSIEDMQACDALVDEQFDIWEAKYGPKTAKEMVEKWIDDKMAAMNLSKESAEHEKVAEEQIKNIQEQHQEQW